jgi:hypothetical protein
MGTTAAVAAGVASTAPAGGSITTPAGAAASTGFGFGKRRGRGRAPFDRLDAEALGVFFAINASSVCGPAIKVTNPNCRREGD